MLGLRCVGRVDGILSFVATPQGCKFWCADGRAAAVFGCFIVYRTERDLADAQVRRHEVQHILQARTTGRIRFWRMYRRYNRQVGYDVNPFEVDARRAAQQTKQAMFDRLRKRGLLQ